MRQRREAIQHEIDRLFSAVAAVGHSPALVNAISDREKELAAHILRVRQFVTDRLGNIRELLYADVQRAKGEFAKHVSSIEMFPQSEGKESH